LIHYYLQKEIILLFIISVIGLFSVINCEYEITRQYPGGDDAFLIIPITEDINGWEATLTFDNTVKLTVKSVQQ
jgi:hypothetical protein